MGKPLTREIAGLVWTYDGIGGEWATPCGLRAWRCRDGRFTGGEADGYHPTLTAACEAEVAHREAMRASPTLDPLADEREAQRRDERAYYRNLAGWALAALVLVALCSGVLR